MGRRKHVGAQHAAPLHATCGLLRLRLRALFPDAVDPSGYEQCAHHCECGPAIRADERELAREPAHDEDHADDEAAHVVLRGDRGTGTIGAGFGEVLGRPSLPDIITYPSTTSHTGVHVSTSGGGKNQPRINIYFSTCNVDSG